MEHFVPRMDCLPPPQQAIWPQLEPARPQGMVLYGGTAVALRLGHRSSIDFDFFTDLSISQDMLCDKMPFLEEAEVIQNEKQSLSFLAIPESDSNETVKLSFFGGLDFGRVGIPDMTSDGVLAVASLDDMMAAKLKVVQQRASSKDYLDIAAMIGAGVSLAKGLASARALYGKAFQPSESLKALVYFGDGDLATLDDTIRDVLIEAVSAVDELPVATRLSRRLSSLPD